MDCAEYQKNLPEIMETGGSAKEQQHLGSCAICSDLIQDLRYIAEAAKLLVPMEEPSPKVWEGIEKSIREHESPRPARGPARVRPFLNPAYLAMATAAAAVLVLAVVLSFRSENPPATNSATSATAGAVTIAAIDDDDIQLLEQVAARYPGMRATYEQNLRSVNHYISDAKRSVQEDPNDEDAREQLMNAYEQKAALYDMANSRPVQ